MTKKLFILSLGLGLFLTGCETNNVSEDIQMNDSASLVKESNSEKFNKIHTPDWMIHTPDWMKEEFSDCDNFPEYTGPSTLNLAEKDNLDFGKDVMVENLHAGGVLNICGHLGVANKALVKKGGVVTISGMMSVGSEEKPKDLRINYGGHLNVRGYLVVTGDLILGNGASLHFISDNPEFENKLIVLGEVKEADYSHLSGDFSISHDLHDLEGEHEH